MISSSYILKMLNSVAKHIGKFTQIKQHTPEWYKVRSNSLTATKISSILDANPYMDRNELINSFGQDDDCNDFNNDATRWGNRYEGIARELFEKRHHTNVTELGLAFSKEHNFIGASPDGITDDGILTEFKCMYQRPITYEIPFHYWIQIQIQLYVWELDKCFYSENTFEEITKEEFEESENNDCIVNRNNKRTFLDDNGNRVYCNLSKHWDILVERDDIWLEKNIKTICDFWNSTLKTQLEKNKQTNRQGRKRKFDEDITKNEKELPVIHYYNLLNYLNDDGLIDWLEIYGIPEEMKYLIEDNGVNRADGKLTDGKLTDGKLTDGKLTDGKLPKKSFASGTKANFDFKEEVQSANSKQFNQLVKNHLKKYSSNSYVDIDKLAKDKLYDEMSLTQDQISILVQGKALFNQKRMLTEQCIAEGKYDTIFNAYLESVHDTHKKRAKVDMLVKPTFLSRFLESENAKLDKIIIDKNAPYHIVDIAYKKLSLINRGQNISNNKKHQNNRIKGLFSRVILEDVIKKQHTYKRKKNTAGLAQSSQEDSWLSISCYTIGHKQTYTDKKKKNSSDNCFRYLGKSSFKKKDTENFEEAIIWYLDVFNNGKRWSIDPPSRIELYPNMNQTDNDKWGGVKKYLSEKNHEITSIWNITVKTRNSLVERGVTKWSDPDFLDELEKETGKPVDRNTRNIIASNVNSVDINLDKINCKEISNMADIEIYFDFETSVEVDFSNFPVTKETEYVYMIGLFVRNNVNYTEEHHTIMVDELSLEEEKNIYIDFVNTVNELTKNQPNAYLYHWGNAENRYLKKLEESYNASVSNLFLVDLNDVFKSNYVSLSGCTGYGLKEVANNMNNKGYIQFKWQENYNGLQAMVAAQQAHNMVVSGQTKTMSDVKFMDEFKTYNECDCRVMFEIVNYLRSLQKVCYQ